MSVCQIFRLKRRDLYAALLCQTHSQRFPCANIFFIVSARELRYPKVAFGVFYVGFWPSAAKRRTRCQQHLQPTAYVGIVVLFQIPHSVFKLSQRCERRRAIRWVVVKKTAIRRKFHSQCPHAALVENAQQIVALLQIHSLSVLVFGTITFAAVKQDTSPTVGRRVEKQPESTPTIIGFAVFSSSKYM